MPWILGKQEEERKKNLGFEAGLESFAGWVPVRV